MFAPGKFGHGGYKPYALLKVRVAGAKVVPFRGKPPRIPRLPGADTTGWGLPEDFSHSRRWKCMDAKKTCTRQKSGPIRDLLEIPARAYLKG